MNIVGFNFSKLSAERKKAVVGQVNIKNNITINDVKQAKLGMGVGQGAVSIKFVFVNEYEPDMALMKMEGEILILSEEKQTKAIMKKWKEGNKMLPEVGQMVMNQILNRCNIQALLFSKDLNLPSPVPMPRVKAQEQKKAKKKKK
ncbi:MAG: hypothetical protein OXR66_07545 [Candidatus Woesearchaeota archaeon]|nr:hypothetical protein [Candidatus Woesearchaeota archaeon]